MASICWISVAFHVNTERADGQLSQAPEVRQFDQETEAVAAVFTGASMSCRAIGPETPGRQFRAVQPTSSPVFCWRAAVTAAALPG